MEIFHPPLLCTSLHSETSPEMRLAKALFALKQGSYQKWGGWRKQSRPPTFPAGLLAVSVSHRNAVTLVVRQHLDLGLGWAVPLSLGTFAGLSGSEGHAELQMNRLLGPMQVKAEGNCCGSLCCHGPAGDRAPAQHFPSEISNRGWSLMGTYLSTGWNEAKCTGTDTGFSRAEFVR